MWILTYGNNRATFIDFATSSSSAACFLLDFCDFGTNSSLSSLNWSSNITVAFLAALKYIVSASLKRKKKEKCRSMETRKIYINARRGQLYLQISWHNPPIFLQSAPIISPLQQKIHTLRQITKIKIIFIPKTSNL